MYNHIDDGDHICVQWYDREEEKWVDFPLGDLEYAMGCLMFHYSDEPWTTMDITRMAQACMYYTRKVEGKINEYNPPIILGPRLLERFVEYKSNNRVLPCDYYQMCQNVDKYLDDLERTDYLDNLRSQGDN